MLVLAILLDGCSSMMVNRLQSPDSILGLERNEVHRLWGKPIVFGNVDREGGRAEYEIYRRPASPVYWSPDESIWLVIYKAGIVTHASDVWDDLPPDVVKVASEKLRSHDLREMEKHWQQSNR